MKCVMCGGQTTTHTNQTVDVLVGIPGLKIQGISVDFCDRCDESYDALPPMPDLLKTIAQTLIDLNRHLTHHEIEFLQRYLESDSQCESLLFALVPHAKGSVLTEIKVLFPKPVILMRDVLSEENEIEAASQFFEVFHSRMDIPAGAPVIGRYSVLPYYDELEFDLTTKNAWLLNTHHQHKWIADARSWSSPGTTLEGLTPRTWEESDFYHLPEGAYVVKGLTNSRKHQWATRMYAPDKASVLKVANSLRDDTLLSEQGLIARQYVPLKKLGEGLNGLPVTNEWRTFWLATGRTGSRSVQEIAHGFYWSSHSEVLEAATYPIEAQRVAQAAAKLVAEEASFFVLDLAETEDGRWIVIEVNDGQMSGLSMIDPTEFYRNLSDALSERKQKLLAFERHLEYASKIVNGWPEWKRNLLGRVS